MNHISDWLTHIGNKEDLPYLKARLPNVSERLWQHNHHYRELVRSCCEHLKRHALMKLDGYKLPHGTSCANLGIPWNIICYVRERGTIHAHAVVMINPEVTSKSNKTIETTSNCGSIRLPDPIKIMRNEWIDVRWLDPEQDKITIRHKIFRREHCGFTVQHEIDHNLGILITDRQTHQ